MTAHAYIVDALRTPFGRYGGVLASVRTDDLAALPIRALMDRHPALDWAALDDVVYGCANQAGEDNRNVARMAALLAGLPHSVPGITLNRLCASGLDAVSSAARAIRCGEADLLLAGGVESMSRAPFVMPKPDAAYSRRAELYDTTIGWRFVNPRMAALYGTDSMPETAETLADEYRIERAAQDRYALASHTKALAAQAAGRFTDELIAVELPTRAGKAAGAAPQRVEQDEHPRATTLEALARLPGIVREGGSVTAGNASGVNDGAAALLLASESALARHGLTPRARVLGMVSAGVAPRVMGIGPVPATERVLAQTGLTLAQMDVIELNEAFAAQTLAVLRSWKLADDDARVNPNGGAIALGHPLGASGARLVTTAVHELQRRGGRYALCTMCVGVGQGVALVLERV